MSSVDEKNNERRMEVADRLHSASIRLLRRLRLNDKASGVGPAQLSALSVLIFVGRPLSLGELAEAEQVTAATMSRVVAGLKRGGLARVTAAKEDRRRLVLEPTAKGTAILQAGRKRRVEALAGGLTSLKQEELETVERAVELIRNLVIE